MEKVSKPPPQPLTERDQTGILEEGQTVINKKFFLMSKDSDIEWNNLLLCLIYFIQRLVLRVS
ncbi:hypothetical protein Bpfe_027213, partial [Biomphalaria pfeifferi]